MDALKERRDECIATLTRERLRYEVILRTVRGGRVYLSWFSVQEDGGADVQTSEHDVDKVHLDYWNRCIDDTESPEDHEHVVTFAPPEVESVM